MIDWLAVQPWSSGVVGGSGGSYLGCTQWLAAREQPPAFRALAPAVNPADMYNECSYQGGVKVLHDLRWVAADIIPGELRRRVARGEAVPNVGPPFDLDLIFSELPLGSHPLIPDDPDRGHPARATALHSPSLNSSNPTQSTSYTSIYGRRRMCFCRATASVTSHSSNH